MIKCNSNPSTVTSFDIAIIRHFTRDLSSISIFYLNEKPLKTHRHLMFILVLNNVDI